MKYPVDVRCNGCGTRAVYTFATEGAYDEFMARWKDEHDGKTCTLQTFPVDRMEQQQLCEKPKLKMKREDD